MHRRLNIDGITCIHAKNQISKHVKVTFGSIKKIGHLYYRVEID